MFELIEKLRQKPEKTKKQIAFLGAFFVSSLIFVVWLTVLFPDFRRNQKKESVVTKNEPSPFDTLGEIIGTGVSAIGGQASEVRNTVSSVATGIMATGQATTSEVITTEGEEQKVNDQIPMSNDQLGN